MKKKLHALISVVLAAAVLIGSLSALGVDLTARGEERIFDIGVNAESVTAAVKDGVLTIKGSGAIRDFTPETAPFANEPIRTIEIGPDVTAIGAYTFYNCGGVTGTIILPAGLVQIGDGAFSGDSMACAPKPDFVENPFAEALRTRRREDATSEPEPTPAPTEEPEDEGTEEETPEEEPVPGTEIIEDNETPQTMVHEVQEHPAAAGEPEPEEEPEAEEQGESRYIIEKITQQEIGKDLFYPREDGPVFSCSAENETFRAAMLAAGYREVETVIPAAFDCGHGESTAGVLVKNLPVVGGTIVLPDVMPEFAPPESTELTNYTFSGWTESQDEAYLVRRVGSVYTVGDREDLYFIADWHREVLIDIVVQRDGDDTVFSVPDVPGYDLLSFRWQMYELPAGAEPPVEQDLLYWKDIPGETEQTYRRTMEEGDQDRLFRCVVTVEKQRKGFSLFALFSDDSEELPLAAKRGVGYSVGGQYILSCEKGSYNNGAALPSGADPAPIEVTPGDYVVIPDCTYAAPTVSGSTIVFNGWIGSDGQAYDPGQIILLEDDLTLTAQWAAATIRYVDGSKSDNQSQSVDGQSVSSAYKYFVTKTTGFSFFARTYPGAYDDFVGGTKYTNIIVICGNTSINTGDFKLGAGNVTFTTQIPGTGTTTGDYTLTLGADVALSGDTRFHHVKIAGAGKNICAQGNQLVMGEAVDTGDYTVNLYGGNYNTGATMDPELIVQSGSYLAVFGGNYAGNITGNAKIQMSGNAKAGLIFGASWEGGSVLTGTTRVWMSGNSRAAVVVGGNRSSNNNAGVTGLAHVMVGGSAVVEENERIRNDNAVQFFATGFIAGSGADACIASGRGNSRGGTLVEVRENASIARNVFGGSGDGWSADISDPQANTWLGAEGDMRIVIDTEGTIGGNVVGGGNARSCSGSSTVEIQNGTINGNVYGGGVNGNLTGAATITMTGGTVKGSIYAGGDEGVVTGNAEVAVSGGQVTGEVTGGGSVYGGGKSGNVGGNTSAGVSDEGWIAHSVYGGGDQGSVAGSSSVTVTGSAFVGGNVFGGSKGLSGRTEGTVSENSSVTVTGGQIGSYTGDGETTLVTGTGRVFGGGEFAPVTGSASVTVNVTSETGSHPPIGDSVYGGGSQANVGGKSSVQLESGQVAKNVYGAGYGDDSSSGSTQVTVNGGSVGQHVYGGGARGSVTGKTLVEIKSGVVTGCVFAAGEGAEDDAAAGRVSGGTEVVMTGGALNGGLYGGGNMGVVGSGSDIPGDNAASQPGADTIMTEVKLQGGSVNRIFGGGAGKGSDVYGSSGTPTGDATAHGTVFGSTRLTITGGSVAANAFGGGNFAFVSGNTHVSVSGHTTIGGSVFGGSNLSGDPSQGFDGAAYLIKGGSNVIVNGADGLSLGGGVLGSGNLTRVLGTRKISISDYTGTLTTLQRADLVKLSGCDVSLAGEDDKSDDAIYGSKKFSITQVGDMRLYNTVLTVKAEAKSLGFLGNYDSTLGGDTVFRPGVAIADRSGLSSAEAGRSTVSVKPGVLFQIRYTDEDNNNAYGHVGGVFWLKMSERPGEGMGIRVEGSYASDTGAFLRAPEETEELVAVKIGTVSSRWRLGGSALRWPETLTASRTEEGQNTVVTPEVELPISEDDTVYYITGVTRNGDFHLILPTETNGGANMTITLDEDHGKRADNTFALRVDPVGTGWKNLDNGDPWGAYVVSGDEGETISYRGSDQFVTGGAGKNGGLIFSLVYDGTYNRFSGGTVELTFEEYPKGAAVTAGGALNTVVVVLTLEGDLTGSTQSVKTTQGRNFMEFEDLDPVKISAKGAVTVDFLTEYYPTVTGSSNMLLHLCREENDGTAVAVAFPTGTRVVLADRSAEDQCKYYYSRAEGETALCLDGFSSMGANGTSYPGPADLSSQLAEKLLFAVDFSDADTGLAQGKYFLVLAHSAEQDPTDPGLARAGFSVEGAGSYSLQLVGENLSGTTWQVQLTTSVPTFDSRYADGACVHVSLKRPGGGQTAAFPALVNISEEVLRDRDGTISFAIGTNATTTVTFDFADVPDTVFSDGTYELHATMVPKVGLQVGSDAVTGEAPSDSITMTLQRTAAPQDRSVSITLPNNSLRLIDASGDEGGKMEFNLNYENLQDGDVLTVELFRKTGPDPIHEENYELMTEAALSGWTVHPASGTAAAALGNKLTITVPQGQESGTYRVWVKVMSGSNIVADQMYNFIVK